jgi:hypothetical protein
MPAEALGIETGPWTAANAGFGSIRLVKKSLE